MSFERGDIIEYPFLNPETNKLQPHPGIILSNQAVYDADECYICVMLTTSRYRDKFTFEITNDMLVRPNNVPFAQARLHLITYVREKDIKKGPPKNRMKESSVNRLVEFIKIVSLSALND